MIKYFDADWKETTADKATYAVELKVDKTGKVVSSTIYVVKNGS